MKVTIEKTNLIEITQAELSVDREAGVIRNVKVLGPDSANGRTYSSDVMRKTSGMYESLGVYVNHPPRSSPDMERRVEDRVGWLERVHVKQDGMYADLNVLKSHPMAGALFEAAERNPRLIGLSHNASGKERRKGNSTFVEEIQRVRSVDIVTVPATTRGLFESEEPKKMATLRECVKNLDQSDAAVKWLSELIEAEPAMADAPMEDGGEDAMKAAFRAAVVAAFDDDKLDAKATMKKISEVLKAYDKVMAKGEEPPAEDKPVEEDKPAEDDKPAEAEKPVAESADLAAKVAKLEARDKARTLMEDAGIIPTDAKHREAMLESLASVNTEHQQMLIETWQGKKTEPQQRPRSGASTLRESKSTKRTPEEFAKQYLQ